MDYYYIMTSVWFATIVSGMVLALNGVVRLAVRNREGPWKDGGASLFAGVIVAGLAIGLMLWIGDRLIPPPG